MRQYYRKLIFMILIVSAVLWAQDEVRMDLQVTLFMKLLKYDRNITQRGAEGLKLGVIYNPNNKKSVKTYRDFEKEFNSLESKSVKGMTIILIPVKGADQLQSAIKNYGINMLYVCPGLDDQLSRIVQTCSENKILTMTGYPPYADKGVAVGLSVENGKPRLVINTTVSKQVGSNFSADVLRLARVIK
ncbi:MAG: hypothetical protein DRN14_07250 [Thermoplasmata archaeon]|nr:MAG: hypothetical protein DRN14_07250 [Thermoplasmata archaeon]